MPSPLPLATLKREIARFKRDPVTAFTDFVMTPRFQELGPRAPARDHQGEVYPIGLQTASQYVAMFRHYINWLESQGIPFLEVDTHHIVRFLDAPRNSLAGKRGNQKRSRVRRDYLRLLYRTYTHLGRLGNDNPALTAMTEMKGANSGFGTDARKEFLDADERDRFLQALPEVGSSPAQWKRQRDRAMLSVMLGAGLKVSEAITLKKRNVGAIGADGTITITINPATVGGISKPHETILAPFAVTELSTWIDLRRRLKIPGPLLFPASLSGTKPLTKMTVFRQTRETFERAGIKKNHGGGRTLRNTFAVFQLLEHTPMEVSELLGHFEEKSILGYVAAKEQLRAPVEVSTL